MALLEKNLSCGLFHKIYWNKKIMWNTHEYYRPKLVPNATPPLCRSYSQPAERKWPTEATWTLLISSCQSVIGRSLAAVIGCNSVAWWAGSICSLLGYNVSLHQARAPFNAWALFCPILYSPGTETGLCSKWLSLTARSVEFVWLSSKHF